MAKLTAAKVHRIKNQGMHGDGGGLYLNVAKGGSKSWILKVQIKGGKRREIGLGGVDLVSLIEARKKAVEYRQAARAGIDPKANATLTKATPLFKDAMLETYQTLRPTWRSERRAKNWMQSMNLHAKGLFSLRVDAIGQGEVLGVLLPIWQEKNETARKLRTAIKSVFSWAQAHGHIKSNPAGEAIGGALPKVNGKGEYAGLPHDKVGEALKMIRKSEKCKVAARCLEFLILTGARSGEARGARWSEIDLDAKVWTMPADIEGRAKSGKEFRQPLSEQAAKLLSLLWIETGAGEFVFPASRNGVEISDTNMKAIMKETGLAEVCNIHGFRKSFSTWANEQGFDPRHVEMCERRGIKGVESVYNKAEYINARREIMQAWADYLATNKGG